MTMFLGPRIYERLVRTIELFRRQKFEYARLYTPPFDTGVLMRRSSHPKDCVAPTEPSLRDCIINNVSENKERPHVLEH